MATHEFEVVIIGAGPAGMCAGLYAGRSMLKSVVLERGFPGGELLNTEVIEDYIGFEHILGHELAMKFQNHAEKFGAQILTSTPVESVKRAADGLFDVTVENGDVYRAPAVIVTAGGTPVKLDIPGEVEYAGKGVSYCAICDGAFYKGHTIIVVGGGDAALEEADFLTRYAEKVYLVHRRDEFRASKAMQERVKLNEKIRIFYSHVVTDVLDVTKDHVTGVRLRDLKTGEDRIIDAAALFVAIGHTPMTELFRGQLELHDNGYIKVEPGTTRTSVPGVFAAGDVADWTYRQAVTAAGTGCMAALDAERFLAGLNH